MVKKLVVRSLFIICVFVFFVLYLAPANKLVSIVDLPKNVKLYDVKGDLWNGHVETVDIDNVRLSKVDWKLNLFTLLFSKGMTVTISDPEMLMGSFEVNVMNLNKEVRVKNVKFTSYLEKVTPLLKFPMMLKTEGGISGSFDTVILDGRGNFSSADGTINFEDVLVQHPFDSELFIDVGRITVSVKGDSRSLKLHIDQNSDVFSFNGDVTVNNLSEYVLSGGIRPKGSMPDKVASLISMLGKPGSDGQIRIKYKGRI